MVVRYLQTHIYEYWKYLIKPMLLLYYSIVYTLRVKHVKQKILDASSKNGTKMINNSKGYIYRYLL